VIEFKCPICTRVLKISPEHAGEEGACRYCGGRIVVPTDIQSLSDEATPDFSPSPPKPRNDADTARLQEQIEGLKTTVRTLQTQLEQSRDEVQQLAGQLERIKTDMRSGSADTTARLKEIQAQIVHLNEQILAPAPMASTPPNPEQPNPSGKACPLCARWPYVLPIVALVVVLAVVLFVDHPVTDSIRTALHNLLSQLTQR